MIVERNQSNNSLPKSSTSNESSFPSDKELAYFQKQSNTYLVSNREHIMNLWREFTKNQNSKNGKIKKQNFIKIFNRHFKLNNDSIAEHLFKRFGIRKYKDKFQVERPAKNIELHDIMIALTLMSRIPNEKKIELIFDLTDVDEDGCLSPEEIHKMIEVIEKVLAKENVEIKIQSRVLLEELSRDKALRRYDWVMKSIGMLESRNKNDEGLITFDEFQKVLDKIPNLKAQFLPRYTDLKSVLKNENSELEIKVPDNKLEDFLIFRYEMQAVLADTFKSDKNKKKLPPIQKNNKSGNQGWKKECPGLINGGKMNKKFTISEEYWEYNSMNNMVLVREVNAGGETVGYNKVEKEKAVGYIIPQRPVIEAMQELKKSHEQNQQYKYDDEEAAGYEALVNKVMSQVADSKKKQLEVGEVQVITRKSDFKFLNERH